MQGRDHADRHAGQQRADDAAVPQRISRHAREPGACRRARKRLHVVGVLPAPTVSLG